MASFRLLGKAYMTLGIMILLTSIAVFIVKHEVYFKWLVLSAILIVSASIINFFIYLDHRKSKSLIKIEEQVKFKRKVKTGLLVKKSIVYRIIVTLSQIVLMYVFTGNVELSVGFSILWNIWNTVEYFAFDYVFCRLFKIGKDN